MNNVAVANKITSDIYNLRPARVFIDIGGLGAGVYDILNDRGYGKVVRGINFGAKAIYNDRYVNKRAEMWDELKEWLQAGGALPVSAELKADLCGVRYDFDAAGKMRLESKDILKARTGRSPDLADALALTFAAPVQKQNVRAAFARTDYEVLGY